MRDSQIAAILLKSRMIVELTDEHGRKQCKVKGSKPDKRRQAFRSGRVSYATSLELGKNRLNSFCRRDFRYMTALRRLGLEGNRLTTVVADFFYGLDSLEVMNLDHNRLGVSARPNNRA